MYRARLSFSLSLSLSLSLFAVAANVCIRFDIRTCAVLSSPLTFWCVEQQDLTRSSLCGQWPTPAVTPTRFPDNQEFRNYYSCVPPSFDSRTTKNSGIYSSERARVPPAKISSDASSRIVLTCAPHIVVFFFIQRKTIVVKCASPAGFVEIEDSIFLFCPENQCSSPGR